MEFLSGVLCILCIKRRRKRKLPKVKVSYIYFFFMDRYKTKHCKLTSFNCKSIKRSINDVHELCKASDVVALQETWLLPHDIPVLGTVHCDFEYTGKGRPYGGVAIL